MNAGFQLPENFFNISIRNFLKFSRTAVSYFSYKTYVTNLLLLAKVKTITSDYVHILRWFWFYLISVWNISYYRKKDTGEAARNILLSCLYITEVICSSFDVNFYETFFNSWTDAVSMAFGAWSLLQIMKKGGELFLLDIFSYLLHHPFPTLYSVNINVSYQP